MKDHSYAGKVGGSESQIFGVLDLGLRAWRSGSRNLGRFRSVPIYSIYPCSLGRYEPPDGDKHRNRHKVLAMSSGLSEVLSEPWSRSEHPGLLGLPQIC
jgi:hypothetical protein